VNTNLRTFYTIILTQVLSIIGSRISALAISIYVFNETQQATPLALVMFFMVVPPILLSGLAGVLTDRWNRRLLMVLADVGQAVATILLLVSFISGGFEIWHLYAVTLLQSIFGVFQMPALQASITMLVPDDQRDQANALHQMAGPLANVIAPTLAGVIYAAVGVRGAIAIDLMTFLIAIAVIARSHIPEPKQTTEGAMLSGSLFQQTFDGLRYLWARKALLGLVVFFAVINLLATAYSALETPYLLSRTGDEALLGLLLSVSSAGALIGGIVYGIWGGTRPRVHTVMGGVLVMTISLVLLGMSQSGLALAVTTFLVMAPLPMANAAAMSILQAKVAPDVQGRVFAAVQQIAMLMMPIGTLAMGPLADQVFEPAVGSARWDAVTPLVGSGFGAGMGLMIVIGGAMALTLTALVYVLPAIRRVEADLPDYLTEDKPEILTPEAAPAT